MDGLCEGLTALKSALAVTTAACGRLIATARATALAGLIVTSLSVSSCGRREAPAEPNEPLEVPRKEVIRLSDDPKAPEVIFPLSVRVEDASVNRFIYEFICILLRNDYKGYRLRVTERREPIGMERFEKAYLRARRITVTAVEKIDRPEKLKSAQGRRYPLPVYRVKAHVELQGSAERDIELMIFKEKGQWVSSH